MDDRWESMCRGEGNDPFGVGRSERRRPSRPSRDEPDVKEEQEEKDYSLPDPVLEEALRFLLGG